ncbi:MAG: tyrosine-type recombinase/integrase [Candidatus Levybacteria bacterium]|nr:tyrosine-type recombinase/integrase [Candidatus Levybacteria bacterium]MDZ4227682.1 tyrosine-type recombinase/integrase [Candidatus Levybacteria bacterium]
MKTIDIKDAHLEFKKYLSDNKRSLSTIVAYSKDIEQLVKFLKELSKNQIHDITKEDLESFLAKMTKNGYTPKSISRKLNSTRTFYRFLKINEYITDDPSLLVAHPKYQLAAPRILTPTEYRALRDAAGSDCRMFAVIELLLQTGIRIGELAALKLSDIQKNQLHIAPYEKHEKRMTPLNSRAQEALNRYLKIRPNPPAGGNSEHLFITKSGKPFLIRNIRTAVERYFRLAEVKNAKVNDLRHTFVAHHLKHGVSLVLISKVLGHKRISTTERYLEYVRDRAKENTILTEL